MLGILFYGTQYERKLIQKPLFGLMLWQGQIGPDGFWTGRRVTSLCRKLYHKRVNRILLPQDFPYLDRIKQEGLTTVDPLPLYRSHAAQLALAALQQQHQVPEKSKVALRGAQVDRDLCQAACQLSPLVKGLAIMVTKGGEMLAHQLRMEYGIPVYPDHHEAAVTIHFSPAEQGVGRELHLYGAKAMDCGVCISSSKLPQEWSHSVPLLTALWETGKIGSESLEFT